MARMAGILSVLGLLATLAGCASYPLTVENTYPEKSGRGYNGQTPYQGK